MKASHTMGVTLFIGVLSLFGAVGPMKVAMAQIQVVAGTYGQNCGAAYSNKTDYLAASCNGRERCDYVIDYTKIGDPASGCQKDYIAEWRCGNDPQVYSARAEKEAGFGTTITLSCTGTVPPQGGSQTLSMEYEIDRPGSDFKNFDLSEVRPELCQFECARDFNCRAYTYVKPGVQGPNARCWLKSSIPAQVSNSCCVSGVKGGGSGSSSQTFSNPTIKGYRVDRCLHWAQQCDEPAASAWCQTAGYQRATQWSWEYTAPTYVMGDGKLCNADYCGGFSSITCAR